MPPRPLLPGFIVMCGLWAAPALAPALAQPIAPAVIPDPAGPSVRRFPQPVRVGDLAGRQLLRPIERQDVLGRVASVAMRPDGALVAVISTGGLFGLGTHLVAVPLDATALLGEHLALIDLTPEALRALPSFDPAGAPALAPDQVVRVGLVRPFH